MKLKLKYDPYERFQSDWYRHYRVMFGDVIRPFTSLPILFRRGKH
ncbi:MAG: hypothetical protein O7D32_03740 [bacterium]|nr:hypothetical protein [bacterium]